MSHQKALTQAELKQLIEEEIKLAGEMYRSIDTNGDSKLDKQEVVTALRKRQAELQNNEKLKPLVDFYEKLFVKFEAADRNNDGTLSFVEFITFFDKTKVQVLK